MALIKCPECKKKVSNQCDKCPNCGYPIEAYLQNNDIGVEANLSKTVFYKQIWFWTLIGVVIIGLIVSIVLMLSASGDKKMDNIVESHSESLNNGNFSTEMIGEGTESIQNSTEVVTDEVDENQKNSENRNDITIGNTMNIDFSQIRKKVNSLAGRWYLEGYADVYIDIVANYNSMNMEAQNFCFVDRTSKSEDALCVTESTVYPHLLDSPYPYGAIVWNSGICIQVESWDDDLTLYKIILNDNYFYVDAYKFVRTKGIKTEPISENESEAKIPETEQPVTDEQGSTAPEAVYVTSVTLNESSFSLTIGETRQLTAVISPSNSNNKNITWTSSNNSVATVSSSGVVTAKGKGSVTITVTTEDGGYTASCSVTVTETVSEEYSDVLIISDTRTISNQTIDTAVYITSTGVVTFDNVTVNGSVYCYGKLTVNGGSANNLYAYYWDLGGISSSCNAWDGTHGLVKGAFKTCGDVIVNDNALDYAFNKWGKK